MQYRLCSTFNHLSTSTLTSSKIHHSTSKLLARQQDEDNLYEYYRPQSRATPQGGDMSYTEENIRRSAETFKAIRKVGGVDSTNDVYARGRNR